MLVYKEDKDGNPIYSFVYIDKVIDFIRSIGFKPVINFAFTPSDLASDKNRNVYASPFNISLPKDMNKWTKLVSTLTSHLIDRYSLTNVKESFAGISNCFICPASGIVTPSPAFI